MDHSIKFTVDPELAFRSSDAIDAAQRELLRRHVLYLAERSPWYRRLFAENGIDPAAIATVGDLATIPFTTKADLEGEGGAFLCAAPDDIVDLCLTSGTTGQPVAMLQTRLDLERLGYNEEQAFRAAGITAADRVLIAAAVDRCFMAGLAYFLGLTRLGAMAIRGGSGSLPVLKELVRRHRPTVIVGVPSFLAALAVGLAEDGVEPASTGVKKLVCIGEPIRMPDLSLSALGERLVSLWHAEVFGTYAATEIATAFCDCTEGRGGHIPPDMILVEIVDEEGRPMPSGEPGEVVATPLQVTGMPLLRLRTGDIATLHKGPCACGRNSDRLGPVVGRKSQMLKYLGTTVYPPAIFSVLQEMEGIEG
ncbi:MAG: AMP-binding protein, partial [Nitrospirota bacterium]|nr:AMP-binding protein [Nitrospirota bacterium]